MKEALKIIEEQYKENLKTKRVTHQLNLREMLDERIIDEYEYVKQLLNMETRFMLALSKDERAKIFLGAEA